MIETTGLADPAPVIQSIMVDAQCKQKLRLDSVLTVVDSKHLPLHLPKTPLVKLEESHTSEAALQIAFADKILLNKLDLVSETELREIKRVVRDINAEADIVTCTNSIVPIAELLNIKKFDSKRCPESWFSGAESVSSREAATATMTQSKGYTYSFLPKDKNGLVDLKASSKGKFVRPAPLANIGQDHATRDVVATVSLTLPHNEPLDLDNLNRSFMCNIKTLV